MIKDLETKILEAKKAYYNDSNPIMTDDEFDLLVDQLRELDPNNRILSLTGSDIKDKKTWPVKQLTTRMGSLNKINSLDQARDWLGGKGYATFEPKGDGISIELTYKNGKLASAITRGDGYEGEDITSNVLKMKNLPKIDWESDFVLKGEIVIKNEDFKKLEGYSNPRNAAGGISKSKEGKNCEHLTIIYWDYEIPGQIVPENRKPTIFKRLGVEYMERFDMTNLEFMYNCLIQTRDYFGFDVDGFVIKVVEPVKLKGNVPTNQIALKFPAQSAITTIKSIEFVPGRTGRIVPVAEFKEPVFLMGAKIQKCSLGSWALMQEKGLGINAIVKVERANDVIPKIVEVIKKTDIRVTLDNIKENLYPDAYVEGAHLYSGFSPLLERVVHMFKVLDIANISTATINDIINIFELETVYDIFDCDFEDLLSYRGYSDSTVDNIISQIEDKKTITIKTFIECLGIPGFGGSRISEFVNWFGIKKPEDLFTVDYNELKKADGFADISVNNLEEYITESKQEILQLARRLKVIESKEITGVLDGLSFCITGKTQMKRKDFEKLIESNGGKNVSVGKADYLITNDTDSNSAKSKKAREQGIKVIEEREFFKIFSL